jgi:hypothetical protein
MGHVKEHHHAEAASSMHEMEGAHGGLVGCVRRAAARIGTLKEFYEVVTWPQLGLHAKPCGILKYLGLLLAAASDVRPCGGGTVPETGESGIGAGAGRPADLLQALEEWRPTHVEKWLSGYAVNQHDAPNVERKAQYSFGSGKSTPRQGGRGTEPAQFFGMPNERSRWP